MERLEEQLVTERGKEKELKDTLDAYLKAIDQNNEEIKIIEADIKAVQEENKALPDN